MNLVYGPSSYVKSLNRITLITYRLVVKVWKHSFCTRQIKKKLNTVFNSFDSVKILYTSPTYTSHKNNSAENLLSITPGEKKTCKYRVHY